jgi:hypothetical protein
MQKEAQHQHQHQQRRTWQRGGTRACHLHARPGRSGRVCRVCGEESSAHTLVFSPHTSPLHLMGAHSLLTSTQLHLCSFIS